MANEAAGGKQVVQASSSPIIDGCQYCNWSRAVFEEMRAGKVDAVLVTIGYHEDFRETVERAIDWNRRFEQNRDLILRARSAADIDTARASGRTAILFGLQNCSAIEDDIGLVEVLSDLGIRVMQLTYNNQSLLGTGCYEASDSGITRMGREVIGEMNRLGMLIDLSHVSPEVMRQALELSQAPVIFSHSSARALVDHPRNVPDDVLARMAKNGGVVMVTFIPSFVSAENAKWGKELESKMQGISTTAEMEALEAAHEKLHGPAPHATLAQVADHIEHVAKVAGHDHVGIGSDFWGAPPMPDGLEDVSRFPYLFAELVRRGWSDDDLTKLAGGNIVRTLAAAEAVAARLQQERPSSTATIEGLDPRK